MLGVGVVLRLGGGGGYVRGTGLATHLLACRPVRGDEREVEPLHHAVWLVVAVRIYAISLVHVVDLHAYREALEA